MNQAEFMASFRRSAWRLETLPVYNPATDQAWHHWQATGELLPLKERPGKQAWLRLIRDAVRAGKRLGVVHVVDLPLSEYLRFELAQYPENVEAGQDVRIADRAWHPDLEQLREDFWLLDDETDHPVVLVMDYDRDGQYLGERATSSPAVLRRCRIQRNLAMATSVPLQQFLQASRW